MSLGDFKSFSLIQGAGTIDASPQRGSIMQDKAITPPYLFLLIHDCVKFTQKNPLFLIIVLFKPVTNS